jgi:tryptophan halogenase
VSANRPIARVVVVGSAVPLWLCTTALARALEPIGVKVSAVELKAAQSPAQVNATLPPLESFHSKLGVEEAPLLRSTAGSFSLGQLFVDGTESRRPSFFHAWGPYGAAIDGVAFFPCWLKARRHGLGAPLDGFSPAAVGASYGRMIRPTAEVAALGRTEYAYHVPAIAYARELKSLAILLGVTVYEEGGVSVARSEADGSIERLVLDSGRIVQGDLYVDATGSSAKLIGGAPGSEWLSWQTHFSVDRLLTARAPRFTSVPPFSEIRVSRAAWTALHPTQAMTGVVHAYSSGLHSEEEAARLATRVGGSALVDIAIQSVSPGIRPRLWSTNCVAIGSSACALDPIHDLSIHAVQLGIVHLLSLFPASTEYRAERTEYNRQMRSTFERLRDFQSGFYALSAFAGDFWQQARHRAAPAELLHKAETFRARGVIAPMEDETFLQGSWQALFCGLGIVPDSWGPGADGLSPTRIAEQCQRLLEMIRAKVSAEPKHDEYLAALCGRAAA